MAIRATGYLRLHVPTALAAEPAPLLVAIHGYRQPPARMLAYATAVAPAGSLVVAPEGPAAFYGPRRAGAGRSRRVDYGWIADPRRPDAEARNRDLIDQAIAEARRRHAIDARRTWLLGFSQGVGVAVDWFVHNPHRAAGLVGLAGGVPAHGRAALGALAGRRLLWITGTLDAAYPPAYEQPLLARLRESGARLEIHELDSGHDLLEPARACVSSWLAARSAAPPPGPTGGG